MSQRFYDTTRVSPWLMHWNDGYYYLVGYDDYIGGIRTYRVDKMIKISLLPDWREGEEMFDAIDKAEYSQKRFFMFDGDEHNVTLRCRNWFSNVIIDRFGMDVVIIPEDKENFKAVVNVAISDQFLGWLMSFGNNVEVISPAWVRSSIAELAQDVINIYE